MVKGLSHWSESHQGSSANEQKSPFPRRPEFCGLVPKVQVSFHTCQTKRTTRKKTGLDQTRSKPAKCTAASHLTQLDGYDDDFMVFMVNQRQRWAGVSRTHRRHSHISVTREASAVLHREGFRVQQKIQKFSKKWTCEENFKFCFCFLLCG